MAQAVKEGEIKHSTSRDVRRFESQITVDNYTFNTIKEFVYLGFANTIKNAVNAEIKRMITLANRC